MDPKAFGIYHLQCATEELCRKPDELQDGAGTRHNTTKVGLEG